MPGLNLLTFLMLQGEKPSREHIKSEFLRLITQQHADIVPHNMIITKNELKLIDFQDWRNQEIKEFLPGIYCDPRLILKILKVLDSQDRFYIHSETINGFR